MRSRGLFLLLLAGAIGARPLAAQQPIVAAGQPSALGLPFSRFSDPALDDAGRVAFIGSSVVLFQRGPTGIAHLLAAGDAGPAGRIADIAFPAFGGDCVAFRLLFDGGSSGVYRRCGAGVLEAVATDQDSVAGCALRAFSSVVISQGGRVAFSALCGDGTTGLFASDPANPGVLTAAARTGQRSPSGNGTFQALRLFGVTDAGLVGFRALVADAPDGLFFFSPADGDLIKLVVVGDASPAGGRFTTLGLGSLSESNGRVHWTFAASVSDGSRSGIFRADVPLPASIAVVALEGDATPVGGTFKAFANTVVPAINSGGAVAFRATITKELFSAGVFLAAPNAPIAKVVAAGESTAVGRLAQFRDPALATDGGVLVPASLIGGGSGLFRVRGGTVSALAAVGEQTDLGGDFLFAEPSARDAAEDAVFLGLREGVFVASGAGDPTLLARLGDPSPIGGTYQGFDAPAAGPNGQIVFRATVVTSEPQRALFGLAGTRLVNLAKSGDRAPASCGGRFDDFLSSPFDPFVSAAVARGGFAFLADLAHTRLNRGVFLRVGRHTRAIACARQAAPGGGRYTGFGTPAVLPGRQVAFVAKSDGRQAGTRLILRSGGRSRVLARVGEQTGTRIEGRFDTIDPPAGGAPGVAFHAILDQRGREGIFLARGRARALLAGTGDAAPDTAGGHFTGFGVPAFAANTVVFLARVGAGANPAGIFRVPGITTAPPDTALPVEALALVGHPQGGAFFVSLGTPAANDAGSVAVTADLAGGGASRGVFRLR